MRHVTSSLAFAAVAIAISVLSSSATAQTTYVVPYEGILEFDGVVVNQAVAMHFHLYDIDGAEVWDEQWSDGPDKDCTEDCLVTVTDGRFSAALGAHVPIVEALAAGERRFLGVDVRRGDTESDWLSLTGPVPMVEIDPAPFALWSVGSGDFNAIDSVTVDGGATINTIDVSSASASSVSSSGALTATGQIVSTDSQLISSTGGIATPNVGNSSVDVGGDVYIGGGIGDGVRIQNIEATASLRALTRENGDVLGINFHGDFNQTAPPYGTLGRVPMTISGDLTLSGGVVIGDNERTALTPVSLGSAVIDQTQPLMKMIYVSLSTASTAAVPGVDTTNWFCWVGGFKLSNVNMGAFTVEEMLGAYTYLNGAAWEVFAHVYSDTTQTAEVGVICVQRAALTLDATWF